MSSPSPRWSLTLYVLGASASSGLAIDNIRRLCDEELSGRVDLKVVDISDDPAVVITDDVIAIPTLVKHWPAPIRRIVGDLSDIEGLRAGLDIHAPSMEQRDG